MNTRTTFVGIASLLMLCAVVVDPLHAQTGNGVVQGTVLDASRAAIPEAKATLTNTRTGVLKNTVSSSAGVYYFGAVAPGDYTLAIEASGFKKFEGTLGVEVGQTVTVDPIMEVGSVGSTVEVTGVAPVISTEGMQVSDVKDSLRINQLTLN